jgi:hypothetical protein
VLDMYFDCVSLATGVYYPGRGYILPQVVRIECWVVTWSDTMQSTAKLMGLGSCCA